MMRINNVKDEDVKWMKESIITLVDELAVFENDTDRSFLSSKLTK